MDSATTGNTASRNRLTRQMILAFSGLVLLILTVGLASLYRIVVSLDEREAAHSEFLASSVLQGQFKSEKTYLLSHAFWQAAYDQLGVQDNRDWAFDEDNIGPTLFSNDGYDGVFVIDDDRTTYAMLEGQLSDFPLEALTPDRQRVLQQAREAARTDEASAGYTRFRDRPALFAAAVIRPPQLSHHLPAAQRVLVFVRRLSPEVLTPLAASVGLAQFVVRNKEGHTSGQGELRLEDSGYCSAGPSNGPAGSWPGA